MVFDPKKHLSPADQSRLEASAKAAGLSVNEFIEVAVKRELFTGVNLSPSPNRPEPKKREVAA